MIIRKKKSSIKILEPSYALELSKVVIPLSKFFKNGDKQDIYDGTEKIPFGERKNKFKKLLCSEFFE